MKVIYLHGFGSTGSGPKVSALREVFGSESVFSPDLPVDPDLVVDLVSTIVQSIKNEPFVFVGTSLGGFWANYFAQSWNAPCVIINPAISPSDMMIAKLGQIIYNYSTGEIITIMSDYIEKFTHRENFLIDNSNGALINLFVAKDDDVIDCNDTLAALPYTASTTVKDDGGHKFEKHWSDVVAKVKELLIKY